MLPANSRGGFFVSRAVPSERDRPLTFSPMRPVLILCVLLVNGIAQASTGGPFHPSQPEEAAQHRIDSLAASLERSGSAMQENERLVALALTVALGPFGGHRLYLGTGPKVPIIYTLTLGGGFGVLPVIDLFHILLKKDLEPYRNNRNIFMWTPPNADEVTPP